MLDKIEEEVAEVRREVESGATGDLSRAEEEMGDLLFAIANLSRKLGIEPEAALRRAKEKFTTRFEDMEERVRRTRKAAQRVHARRDGGRVAAREGARALTSSAPRARATKWRLRGGRRGPTWRHLRAAISRRHEVRSQTCVS